MNCRKVCRLLSAFIDGSLGDRQNSEMEKHLQECPNCATRLAEMKLIIQAAGELEQLKPGPHFVSRTMCAIESGAKPAATISGWRFAMTLTGTAFVVAACITLIMAGQPSERTLAKTGSERPMIVKLNKAGQAKETSLGFPVPIEVLKRDLAAVDSMRRDSLSDKPTVPLPNLIQQVDFEKPGHIQIKEKGK